MINSSVLRNIFFIVILHLCGKAFCQDTIGELSKTAMITEKKIHWENIDKGESSPDTLILIDRKAKSIIFIGIKKDSVDGNFLYYRKPGRTKVKSMEL
jgi:hypothetical protein